MSWRVRLREAVQRSGVTQGEIAWRAGLSPESLSTVLTGKHARPQFTTIVRIARALRVQVSWLLDEPCGIELTESERATIRAAGVILLDALTRDTRR